MSQDDVELALTQLGMATRKDIVQFLNQPDGTIGRGIGLMVKNGKLKYIDGVPRVYYLANAL